MFMYVNISDRIAVINLEMVQCATESLINSDCGSAECLFVFQLYLVYSCDHGISQTPDVHYDPHTCHYPCVIRHLRCMIYKHMMSALNN